MQSDDLYCKLYVAGASDADALTRALNEIAHGVGRSDRPALDIAVHAESRHLPLDDAQDDFTLWRHYVDVDAADAHTRFDAFLAELVQVVVGLRKRGLRVVAACDFEQALDAATQAAAGG